METYKMTAKIPKTALLARALLKGDAISIMDGFHKFGVTNVPREISRQIEKKFGVSISRDRVDFIHGCGTPGHFYRYRLPFTDYNEPGIVKMRQYVNEFFPTKSETTAIPQTLMF